MVPALWICGPTAVGKSLVALELAEEIEGEIISVDSMQVYRGMDIGTAKPTAKERERVRHHLLDVVDLPGTFTVADFLESVAQAEREVRSRNKTPVYCGGTGLYFKAMSHGIGAGPAPDEKLRRELEEQTIEALLEEVRARDEALWRVLDRSNRRRVVRAVEMLRLSGKKVSESRSAWGACSVANVVAVGLRRTREELVQRIEHRVREMFKAGLVEEVERLAGSGLLQSATARQALGLPPGFGNEGGWKEGDGDGGGCGASDPAICEAADDMVPGHGRTGMDRLGKRIDGPRNRLENGCEMEAGFQASS